MLEANNDIDEYRTIFAGKFRRYHGESWLRRVTDIKTLLLNIRDFFYFLIGLIQSVFIIKKIKPSVVFMKGGFVGVPVGLSSALWGYPIVTHDSDSISGLANRMVSKWAKVHATAMSAEYYGYDEKSVKQVGVLVSEDFELVNDAKQIKFKEEINVPPNSRVLMVTGGSNGARVINLAMAKIVPDLIEEFPDLYIIHQVGKGKMDTYKDYSNERLIVEELLSKLYRYSGSADVIVTRAGANTIAEFGIQAKACIVVPNPLLTGGHQVLNANYLRDKSAALVIDEAFIGLDGGSALKDGIVMLLKEPDLRSKYANNLNSLTIKDATEKLADLLIKIAR